MIMYLATPTTILTYNKAAVEDVYVLETFHAIKNKKECAWINPDKFILDSGAYTYMRGNGGKVADWDKYIHLYAAFIVRNKVKYFFELDIDQIVGYDEVLRLRFMLEKLTGLKSIPVWHRTRGLAEWEATISDYDYISISASGNNFSSEWTRTLKGAEVLRQMVGMANKKGVRVHGLGYTKNVTTNPVGFYSVDSTAWNFCVRASCVHYFDGSSIKKIKKGKGMKMKPSETYIQSWGAWAKLQRHLLINTK